MNTPAQLVTSLLLGMTILACGNEDGGTTDTEPTENKSCKQPDYPAFDGAENSCGCGYSAAFAKEANQYYLDCISEECAIDRMCLSPEQQPHCLWDGLITTSHGSFCSAPCGAGQKCPIVDGFQTICSDDLFCILPCDDTVPCPSGMFCNEEASVFGIRSHYCLFDFSP